VERVISMGRKKKAASPIINKTSLTVVDMLYLDEYLKSHPKPDWELLSAQLGKSIEVIEKYANMQDSVPEIPAPKEVRKELTEPQKNIRKIMSGHSDSGGQTITVMSDAASAQIAEVNKARAAKTSQKYSRCIHKPA
jgi:hypothetical protein